MPPTAEGPYTSRIREASTPGARTVSSTDERRGPCHRLRTPSTRRSPSSVTGVARPWQDAQAHQGGRPGRSRGGEVGEALEPGHSTWSHDGIICTGETYKAAVKLTFAKGASLEDPAKLFNSSLEREHEAGDRHPRGREGRRPAFKALIRAAVDLNTAGAKRCSAPRIDRSTSSSPTPAPPRSPDRARDRRACRWAGVGGVGRTPPRHRGGTRLPGRPRRARVRARVGRARPVLQRCRGRRAGRRPDRVDRLTTWPCRPAPDRSRRPTTRSSVADSRSSRGRGRSTSAS